MPDRLENLWLSGVHLYVVTVPASIKGAILRTGPAHRLSALPEQRVGRSLVAGGKGYARFGAGDFSLQNLDAGMEFVNRQGVQILMLEPGNEIACTARQILFKVHGSVVDPLRYTVNKGAGIYMVKKTGALLRGGKMAIAQTMQGIEIREAGGPEVLVPATMPVPLPQDGEVLIRVAAAGVNRPDVMQRRGLYPAPEGASPLPGLEVAGVVVALGRGVPDALMGQGVCALVSGGGYAEYCTAPVVQCLPVPPALTMAEAAALPETLFTVWTNLFERAYAVEGDTALVHGGTSGIGTMAIALGKLFGLTIIVTCGSDEKCARALELGAAHAINYKTQDFVAEVARITDGKGCQAVLDMVGGDYVPRNLACLAEEGRHVTIAVQGGLKAEVSLVDIMRRRLTLTGSTLRARSVAFKGMVADEIHATVWPHVEAGDLKPVIDSVYPLAQAADAHRRLESGAHIGKIALTMEGAA